MLVLGLFATPEDAALALDNLAEADFGPSTLSLVMKSPQEVEKLADASGPLAGTTVAQLPGRLAQLGVSSKDAAAYQKGVLQGGVFIAISAGTAAPAAAEMLKDANAQAIKVVKDG